MTYRIIKESLPLTMNLGIHLGYQTIGAKSRESLIGPLRADFLEGAVTAETLIGSVSEAVFGLREIFMRVQEQRLHVRDAGTDSIFCFFDQAVA